MVRVNALKLGVTVLFLAAAAGCSASTSNGPPENGGSYDSPEQLAEALKDAGLECSGLREMPKADDPDMTKDCTSNDGDLILRIYTDDADLHNERVAFEDAFFLKDKTMLAGKNWTIVGPDVYIDDAAEKLGGDIVTNG